VTAAVTAQLVVFGRPFAALRLRVRIENGVSYDLLPHGDNVAGRAAPDGDRVAELLRLYDEPCVHLDERLVHRILADNIDELCARTEKTLTGVTDAAGAESLGGKDLFYFGGDPGDLRVMPYNDGRHMTVKVIGTNEAQTEVPDKISVGKCLLIHPQDHYVMGILDVAALSSLRTAVGILLGRQASHPGEARAPRLGIVGAGRVGFYTALAFQRAGLIDSCAVYDPAPGAVERMRELCRLEAGPGIVPCSSLTELLGGCDSVALATDARQPVLGRADIETYGLRFVASVGADADNLRELGDDLPGAVSFLVGSPLYFCLGDLKRWQQRGLLHPGEVTYLHQALAAPRPTAEATCYVSTGFPMLDHAAATLAYEIATAHGLGRPLHTPRTTR
jgi:ornithine cyclodeaminase/alanine dehydrogenase-like protein (mu-crystallin family)